MNVILVKKLESVQSSCRILSVMVYLLGKN